MTRNRGVFIGVAVGDYDHHASLPWASYDLDVMAGLCQKLDFSQRFVIGNWGSPTTRELTGWLHEVFRRIGPDAVLVLYWAGHGVVEDGTHYLLASDSPARGFVHGEELSAIPATVLAQKLVTARIARALIVIDACKAGARAMDFAAAINEGLRSKTAAASGASGIVVMAVSRPTEAAVDGALARVLEATVLEDERCATFRDKYVRLGELFVVLNESLSKGGTARPVSSNVVDWTAPLDLLPNPRWGRGPVWNDSDGVLFDQQARGVSRADDTGWYFSGREEVMTRISKWLDPSGPGGGLLVVTGPPGSGKSAVIARAVTLSRRDYRSRARDAGAWNDADRDRLPPEGSVHAAVRADKKTLGQVVADLAGLLGIDLPSGPDQSGNLGLSRRQALLDEVQEMASREPVTVVLDGLDEAWRDQDLAIADFLAELATLDRLRVLVGTRPGRRDGTDEAGGELLRVLGVGPDRVIDLSRPAARSDLALAGYLQLWLIAAWHSSNLVDAGARAAEVADAMARKLKG